MNISYGKSKEFTKWAAILAEHGITYKYFYKKLVQLHPNLKGFSESAFDKLRTGIYQPKEFMLKAIANTLNHILPVQYNPEDYRQFFNSRSEVNFLQFQKALNILNTNRLPRIHWHDLVQEHHQVQMQLFDLVESEW